MRTPPRFRDAIELLSRHGVDFIVVGGVAGVLGGAPVSTFDLDVVHSRTPSNLDRLLAALTELQAFYRDLTDRRLPADRDSLAGTGHNLMLTKFGPVDFLGTIGHGHDYDGLLPESAAVALGRYQVRVLSLDALIRIKEETASEKDRAALIILRRTRAERDG